MLAPALRQVALARVALREGKASLPGAQSFADHSATVVRIGEDKQVDRQEEQIAHESNVIMPTYARKTAWQGQFGLKFTNLPPTPRWFGGDYKSFSSIGGF